MSRDDYLYCVRCGYSSKNCECHCDTSVWGIISCFRRKAK